MLSFVRRLLVSFKPGLASRHTNYVLAAVNLATVVGLLALSHGMYSLYQDALSVNRLWAERQARCLALIQLAGAVNAPGNDVFRTLDVDQEGARLTVALRDHDASLAVVRRDLSSEPQSPATSRLLEGLNAAAARVRHVERQARTILEQMRGGEVDAASRLMAAMDRWHQEAVDQYLATLKGVDEIQSARMQVQIQKADRLGWIAMVLSGAILILVGLVTWQGHKLTRHVAAQQESIQATQAALVTQNERLEQQAQELREAQCRAEQDSRSKSAFLANMSHELRTPLTAILGYAENLNAADLNAADQTLAIQTIRRNGEHLLEIINDILDLSKIEAGRMEIEQIDCSAVQVLADVVSWMRVRAKAKRLSLSLEFRTPMPVAIHSDPTRLRQILLNLIGNAIKFTNQGSVRVVAGVDALDGSPGLLACDIIDTGIGIPTEQIASLYQPFQQADTSTTRKFGGTGLGLSISKRLVEMLGGSICVTSEVGKGTTFRITVPTGPLSQARWIERPSEAIAQQRRDDPQVLAKSQLECRVLLAEDGPDNQRLISFLLQKAGAEVVIVENGEAAVAEAWQAFQSGEPFDVILMDMQMPVMDGYAAASQLRQRRYPGAIIALTAHAMSGDREKCLAAGCDDFVTKPLDRTQLFRTIERYVGSPSRTTTTGFGKPVRGA